MQETLRLLSRLLIERQRTLAVAESVTAGYIQYLCSGVPDAASFFPDPADSEIKISLFTRQTMDCFGFH